MQQFIEFFGNHPGLVLAFLGLLGALAWTFVAGGPRGAKLGPLEVTRLINHEDAVIVDVRSDGEFRQGHIINAVHVPEQQLESQIDRLSKYRARPIVTACRTGPSSAKAAGALRRHGFEKVYSLNGGLVAWEGASLPLVKK